MTTNEQDASVEELKLFADENGLLVQVLSHPAPGMVEYTAQGGGFVASMPRAHFEQRFKPATVPGYSLREVSADWLPDDLKVPAYSNGMRWNGWALPYFPEEAAHSLLAHMPDDLRYDSERDAFVSPDFDDESQEHVFAAETLVVDGRAVKVYAIGAGNWCWHLET